MYLSAIQDARALATDDGSIWRKRQALPFVQAPALMKNLHTCTVTEADMQSSISSVVDTACG